MLCLPSEHTDKIKQNVQNLQFCNECGQDFRPFQLICSGCNKTQYYQYKFCDGCGLNLQPLQSICVNCAHIQTTTHKDPLCSRCNSLINYKKKGITWSGIFGMSIISFCIYMFSGLLGDEFHLLDSTKYAVFTILINICIVFYVYKFLTYDEVYEKQVLIQTKK